MIDPEALRLHHGQSGPDTQKRTCQVDLVDTIPLLEWRVLEGGPVSGTGIVDHNVQPAEAIHGPLHREPPALLPGHIEIDGGGLSSASRDTGGNPCPPPGLDVGNHDGCTLLGEEPALHGTHALGCAGDQRDLALKSHIVLRSGESQCPDVRCPSPRSDLTQARKTPERRLSVVTMPRLRGTGPPRAVTVPHLSGRMSAILAGRPFRPRVPNAAGLRSPPAGIWRGDT